MKIKSIEKGLKLSSFACDLCGKEVDLEEVWSLLEEFWSLKGESETYRIHVCSDCLVKEIQKEKLF